MKRHKVYIEHERDGQTLILVALSLIALLAFLALAVDVGHLYAERRSMQNAADAGALAGAREICFGDPALAEAKAREYAMTRNGAQGAVVTVNDGVVDVTASETIDTFFAGIIGYPTADVSAEAAAACGAATSACGLWPVAFDLSVWDDLYCGEKFYVWTDDKEIDCDESAGGYNCDLDDPPDGKSDIIAGGQRAWLDFTTALDPYPDPCDQPGCGASELACRLISDYDARISIPTCLQGATGVKASALNAAEERIGDDVWIPIYSGYCVPDSDASSCALDGYTLASFGCVNVVAVHNNFIITSTVGPDMHGKVIEVSVNCGGECATNCGGTDGTPPNPWDIKAVSLIK